MLGSNQAAWKYSFSTEEGVDFDEEIQLVYARFWELHEFPTRLNSAEGDFAQINVIAKANFAHDFNCDNFGLDAIPNNLQIVKGDQIRLTIRENATTGYSW